MPIILFARGYMVDGLTSDASIPRTKTSSAAFGLSTITDNYGNTAKGKTLTCTNGMRHKLSHQDWVTLYTAVRSFLPLQLDADENRTAIPGNMDSPLKWMCGQIPARTISRK